MAKWIAVSAVAAAACAAAFLLLDPILAIFVVMLLLTGLAVAFLARDWDRHSTYEQREQARALRRKEKWARGQSARDRDRAKWEAHQARQAAQGGADG